MTCKAARAGFGLMILPLVLGAVLQIVGVEVTADMQNGLWLLGTAGVLVLVAAGVVHLWQDWRQRRQLQRERRQAEIHRMACQPPDAGFEL